MSDVGDWEPLAKVCQLHFEISAVFTRLLYKFFWLFPLQIHWICSCFRFNFICFLPFCVFFTKPDKTTIYFSSSLQNELVILFYSAYAKRDRVREDGKEKRDKRWKRMQKNQRKVKKLKIEEMVEKRDKNWKNK